MRRFPCSWDKTLASLGLKRKTKKWRDQRFRRSRLETLEVKALLAADTLLGNETHRWTFDSVGDDLSWSSETSLGNNAQVETSSLYLGGGALRLDGAQDYAEITGGDFADEFSQYSITAWFRADDTNGSQIIYEEGGTSHGIGIRLNGSTLEGTVRINSTATTVSLAGVSAGKWHFVALTFDQGELKLYLDGSASQDVGSTGAGNDEVPIHNDPANIGRADIDSVFATGSDNYFDGLIDEARVYDGTAITAEQVDILADRATIVVDTLADSSAAANEMSLRKALQLAEELPGENTITFDQSLYAFGASQITLDQGKLVIDSDVVIDGPGTDLLTVSGDETYRVFELKAGFEATLSDFTIADGRVTGSNDGGGILSWGDLKLERMTVRDNFAGDVGGGLYAIQGSIEIIDSTFSGNHANNTGGGARFHMVDLTKAIIAGSTFTDNRAENGGAWTSGGGLFLWGSSSGDPTAVITNSTFSGNYATSVGGAIRGHNYADIVIVNSTLVENYAGFDGAGLSLSNSSTVLQNSIVSLNTGAGQIATASSTLTNQNNFIGGDPKLAPLGDYGGPTQTHAVLPEATGLIDQGIGYRNLILADSPEAYYRFDDGPVFTVSDEVSGVADATVEGRATVGAKGALGEGTAVALDGVDSYIEKANLSVGASFSAEAWVSSDTELWNETGWILAAREGNGFLISPLKDARGWSGYVADSAGGFQKIGDHIPEEITEYHHYAVTYDDATGQAVMYFDGQAVASNTLSITRDTISTVTVNIGKDTYDENERFGAGTIDEVAFYNTALDASAIRARVGLQRASFSEQRGSGESYAPRSFGSAVDIGAVEYGVQPIEFDEPFDITGEHASGSVTDNWVASNAAGQSVVVWKGTGPEGSGVYVQQINPNTDATSLPRLVDLGQDASTAIDPRIAVDGAGRYVVVWKVNSGDDTGLWMRRYDATGAPVDDLPVKISSDIQFWTPTVEVNEAGRIVVVWKSGSDDIYFRRYTTSGLSLDAAPRLAVQDTDGLYVSTSGRTAAVTPDGGFYLLWEDGLEQVFVQQFSSSGDRVGNAILIGSADDDTPPEAQAGAQGAIRLTAFDIVADSSGGAYVAWEKSAPLLAEYEYTYSGRLLTRRISSAGKLEDVAEIASTSRHDIYDEEESQGYLEFYGFFSVDRPSMAVDAQGRLGVAWKRQAYSALNADNFALDQYGNLVSSPTFTDESTKYNTTVEINWFDEYGDAYLPTAAVLNDGQTGYAPSLSTDASGNFLLTSVKEGTVLGQRFTLPQSISLVDGVLTIDESMTQSEQIVLGATLVGDDWRVAVNGQATVYSAAGVHAIRVYGGPNNSRIDLSGVAEDVFPNLQASQEAWDIPPSQGPPVDIVVEAGAGNDVVISSPLGGVVFGQEGDDRLIGSAATDFLLGGDGNDTLSGGDGDDTLDGDGGEDVLKGGDGDDTLRGGDDDDLLFGEAGDDALEGGAGNDRLDGGTGAADTLDGGVDDDTYLLTESSASVVTLSDSQGVDTVDLSAATLAAVFSLVDGDDDVFGDGSVQVILGAGFENVIGTPGNDTLTGNTLDNVLEGGAGDDTLDGGGAVAAGDLLLGQAGNDTLIASTGMQGLEGGRRRRHLPT